MSTPDRTNTQPVEHGVGARIALEQHPSQTTAEPGWGGRLALAGVLLAAGVFAFSQVFEIRSKVGWDPSGARFVPLIVCGAWILLAVGNLVQVIRSRPSGPVTKTGSVKTAMLLLANLVVYAFLAIPLGYIIATTLSFVLGARVLGSRRWVRDLLIAVPLSVGVYFGFTELLSIRLPLGVLP